MLAAVATGLFFVFGAWLVRPRPLADERRTRGQVATCEHGWSYGDRGWRYTVDFRDVAGTTHRFAPSLNGGRRKEVGSPVEVAYAAADPAGTARRTDGFDGTFHLWLGGVGVALALLGLTGVLD